MAERSALKMDGIYRFQRHIYDATRAYYLFGRDHLIAQLDAAEPDTTVLEVACGTGRNLIAASREFPRAHHFGFDVSEQMLATAVLSVAKRGLSHKITLASGDATDFVPQDLLGIKAFDRVFISYALSMIPDWQAAVRCAAQSVAPGGRLLIVDFGTLGRYPMVLRKMQQAWLERFSVTPIANLQGELAAIAKELGLSLTSSELFRGYSVYAELHHPRSRSAALRTPTRSKP